MAVQVAASDPYIDRHELRDSCPRCGRGPTAPGPVEVVPGGLLAAYECPLCGREWRAAWAVPELDAWRRERHA